MQRNKKLIGFGALGAILLGTILFSTLQGNKMNYLSTAGFDQNEKVRKEYQNFIHKASSDTDWRLVNANNFRDLSKSKKGNLKGGLINLQGGNIKGRWNERGANNQSGDVREITLDTTNDSLYIVSTSGHIWKGHLTGAGWHSLNDQIVHSTDVLGLVKKNGQNRIITSGIGSDKKQIFYSDNEGKSYTQASGMDFYDTWGGIQIEVLNDNAQTILALVQTWEDDPWGPSYELYRSTDLGENFSLVWKENNSAGGSADLDMVVGDSFAYVYCGTNGTSYRVSGTNFSAIGSAPSSNIGNFLSVTYADNPNTPTFYRLENQTLLKSTNLGDTWTTAGTTPPTYRAKIQADPTTPGKLYLGQVEMHITTNGGNSWNQYSNWYDFYNDPKFPHADLMKFEMLKNSNDEISCFILNHSGIHHGVNTFEALEYLNPEGLNICTYYDFTSFDEPNGFLFCGAQDKGYHGIADDGTSIQNHDFLVTGDYFEMAITGQNTNQKAIWREYPNGDFTYHFNPTNPGDGDGFDTPGDDKQVWVVPSAPFADPNFNGMWIGGGNLNGGSGSYLIKTDVDFGGNYNQTQIDFNFKAMSNSGNGNISALGQSSVNPDRMYVMCADGSFFVSNNQGGSFTLTPNFNGPENEFLFGAEIEVSKKDVNLVFVGGSGYNNPGVYISRNGGNSFTAMASGLPSTFVHELELDSSETYLFAATDAGPYVCNINTGI
ncbi:MAG: hypothetical protein ACJAY8_001281, partial [Sphingobacteriales bacterium]